MQTVTADALIQDAASIHASMHLPLITLSFFLAEDADFTKGKELYALKVHIPNDMF